MKKLFCLFAILSCFSTFSQQECTLDSNNLEVYSYDFEFNTVEDSMFFGAGDHKEYFIKFPEACLNGVDKIWIEFTDTENNTIILHLSKTRAEFLSSGVIVSGLIEYSLGKIFEANYTVSILLEKNGRREPKISKTITI